MKKITMAMLVVLVSISCQYKLKESADLPATENNGFEVAYPNVKTGNRTLDLAYRIAVGDLFTNIQEYRSKLTGEVVPVIIAGVDYNSPWIRDAAINSWNGGSFIVPEVAENTLFSVISKEENEKLKITGQYWDAMLWTTGAWNHYLVTGDKKFLELALHITGDALAYYEETEFDPAYNLFRGLGWSDGVAEYPAKYANTGGSSAAFSWPEFNKDKVAKKGYGIPMMSTYANAIYYNAYQVAVKMAEELGEEDTGHWAEKAENLKEAINSYLWNDHTGLYSLYIDEDGVCEIQEALANAYAIMFGIADDRQTASIFEHLHVSPAGVTCGWPELPRFKVLNKDGMTFGRHNVTVWPQIQGMWADVAAKNKKSELFSHELFTLAEHAVRDMQFSEIYHPVSGERYGGMQMNNGKMVLWESTRRQTWSATAFIRMIYNGIFGIALSQDGISFAPMVPEGIKDPGLTHLKYRNMLLNISIEGTGSHIKSFAVNGIESDKAFIPKDAAGVQNLAIVLE